MYERKEKKEKKIRRNDGQPSDVVVVWDEWWVVGLGGAYGNPKKPDVTPFFFLKKKKIKKKKKGRVSWRKNKEMSEMSGGEGG